MAYTNDDELLCVERVAAMLHVSKNYIYTKLNKEVPVYKPNGTSNAMTLTK